MCSILKVASVRWYVQHTRLSYQIKFFEVREGEACGAHEFVASKLQDWQTAKLGRVQPSHLHHLIDCKNKRQQQDNNNEKQ